MPRPHDPFTITRDDLAALVAGAELPQEQARKILDALTDAIEDGLKRGCKVTLCGFGTFEARQMPERHMRNPRVDSGPGALKAIAARTRYAWRPSGNLKR